MKVYRYNARNRSDIKFNRTGNEKNPNKIRFYAKTLKYAENYKIEYADGESVLESKDISITNLFDMEKNYSKLKTFRIFIDSQIEIMRKDYLFFLSKATKAKEKKNWELQLSKLVESEKQLISYLKNTQFQSLSDFEMQNTLVKELKALGFRGYKTKKEIAIF